MKLAYMKKMDRIIRLAGTRDPDEILACMGFIYLDPGKSLQGFIAKRKNTVYYGVNKKFTAQKYAFCSFHEAYHGLCGHLDTPDFLQNGGHSETYQSYGNVAKTEREANIGAADTVIDTDTFLEMVGYDSADVQAYTRSVESFEQAVEDYRTHYEIVLANGSPEARIRRMEAYQSELSRMYAELQEQAQDILNAGICLSVPEIAHEYGVPEHVVHLKYEAVAIRKYKVPSLELPAFDKVFGGW